MMALRVSLPVELCILVLSLWQLPSASGQQAGTLKTEGHPTMTLKECTQSGCTSKEAKLVLDANWRWVHTTTGYTNCYTGNEFDSTICADPESCALNCAVEAVDAGGYENNYGITAIPGGVKLAFMTGSNVGSRLFMLDDDGESYKMFKLKNREFSLDIDVSHAECGMNGAMYFIEMAANGGKGIGNNQAGAKYGTGYCDAQCPHDIKFVGGQANADWEPNPKDFSGNMGHGLYGSCCAEMDIWEANNMATAYTPHPCNIDTPGQYACEGTQCGDNDERYQGVCDKDGCDINPFRMGNTTFYGKGPEFAINTLKPMTVVTQFLTTDGTDNGDLSEIRRFYVQDGNIVHSPPIKMLPDEPDSITDEFCQEAKSLFQNTDDFTAKGGNAQMGRSLDRGHVAAFSLWDDAEVNMMWLDSSYPTDQPATDPGVKRGECAGGDESSPRSVRSKYGSSGYVSFSNAAVGEIGTLFGVVPPGAATTTSTTAMPHSTTTPSSAWEPVDGGDGRACRGATLNDNSATYYVLHTGLVALEDCKAKCVETPGCQGIEHTASGRCEVWTRAGGIETSKPTSGFACLRYLDGAPVETSTAPATTTEASATTSASPLSTTQASPPAGNPFEGQPWFVNPSYRELLAGSIDQTTGSVRQTLQSMQNVPSAFWIDVKSKIYKGQGHPDHNTVEGILEEAAACSPPSLVVLIVYNLPNRDCFALASNGEICCHYGEDVGRTKCNMSTSGSNQGFYSEVPGASCADGLAEYKQTYVDPFAEVVGRFQGKVPVVLIIEPDSLPNLVTNMADKRPNDFRGCHRETKISYEEGIKYAIERFSTTGASLYVDAGHGGWLGWANTEDDKTRGFADIIASMGVEQHIRGFATNVANYQPLGSILCPEPGTCRGGQSDDPCCADDPCGLQTEWNSAHNELNYIDLLDNRMQAAMPGFKPHFIIDTGRNGVPGARTTCSSWCNPRDVGIGRAPTTATADERIDAYFWLKTPGESDGCTETLPDGSSCPRFDRECAGVDSIGSNTGEPWAPEAGLWFHHQIVMLAENAAMGDVSSFQTDGSCGNASGFPIRTMTSTSLTTTLSTTPTSGVTTPSGACAKVYQQCDGKGHSGPFCCEAGLTCVYNGEYYSQCQPDALLQRKSSRSRRLAFLGTALVQGAVKASKVSEAGSDEL